MAIEDINIGASPNDGTGDTLRNGAIKINNNNADFQNQIDNIVNIEETPASIKQKYESNADTNNFNDSAKQTVANQSGINTGDQTPTNGLQDISGGIGLGGSLSDNTTINLVNNIFEVKGTGLNVEFILNPDDPNPIDSYACLKVMQNIINMTGNLFTIGNANSAIEFFSGLGITLVTDEDIIVTNLPSDDTVLEVVGRDANGNLRAIDKSTIGGNVTASNGLTKVADDIKLGGDFTEDTGINLNENSLQIIGNGANLVFIINDHADPNDNYIDIKCGENVIDMQQQFMSLNAGDNTNINLSADNGIKLETDENINIPTISTDNSIIELIGIDVNGNLRKVDKPKYVSLKAGLTRPSQTTIPLANQSGNSNYEEYLKLSYACTVSDNYFISIAFQWSANTNNTNAKFRLVITDGVTTNFQEVRIEAKDIGGAGQIVDVLENGLIVGQVDTNTDIILQEYFPIDLDLTAGVNYDVSLEFGHESAGSEVTVYSSTIRIEQKTQNP